MMSIAIFESIIQARDTASLQAVMPHASFDAKGRVIVAHGAAMVTSSSATTVYRWWKKMQAGS